MKQKIFHYLNLPYHITNHIVGKSHTPRHRKFAGMIVMAVGVTMAHAFSHIGNMIVAILGDLVGYSIHATGYLPFLHDIEAMHESKQPEMQEQNKIICETC